MNKKEFENTRDNNIYLLNDNIKEILNLKTQIELKNRLISELFARKEKSLRIENKDLKPNNLIYFRQSNFTEYYGSSNNKNIGRIKNGDKWEDHRLTLINHYFKNYEEISELKKNIYVCPLIIYTNHLKLTKNKLPKL